MGVFNTFTPKSMKKYDICYIFCVTYIKKCVTKPENVSFYFSHKKDNSKKLL